MILYTYVCVLYYEPMPYRSSAATLNRIGISYIMTSCKNAHDTDCHPVCGDAFHENTDHRRDTGRSFVALNP